MKSKKTVVMWVVTLLYSLAIFLPYLVPAFNELNPKLFGMPFTVWWSWLAVALYCVCLFIWSRNGFFTSYDNDGEEDTEEKKE